MQNLQNKTIRQHNVSRMNETLRKKKHGQSQRDWGLLKPYPCFSICFPLGCCRSFFCVDRPPCLRHDQHDSSHDQACSGRQCCGQPWECPGRRGSRGPRLRRGSGGRAVGGRGRRSCLRLVVTNRVKMTCTCGSCHGWTELTDGVVGFGDVH